MAVRILMIAAWFGLVTGLVEGAIFLALQMDVTVEIIWISALFDLLLFAAVGLPLVALARFFRRLPVIQICVGLFSFLAFLDWLGLALAERIQVYAIFLLSLGLAVQFTYLFRRHETALVTLWRRSLPWVGALALFAFIGIKGGLWLQERRATAKLPAALPRAPNVLVVVVDALRADHLSSYGYARPTSPNLDRMARQGILFENAFSSSSYTLPSHASMLTGRYTHEHQVEWSKPKSLRDGRYPTLAEALSSRGYRTGGFSANVFWFTRRYGFDRGFLHFEDYFQSVTDMVLRTLYGRTFERFVLQRLGSKDIPARVRASDINSSLLSWIDRDREKPFFAFVNYMDVHDPYLPPAPYRAKFSKLENAGGLLNWRIGQQDPSLTPEQLQAEIDAYDGAIANVDDQIGQLLTELQKRGLYDNTLIVITSDHGESLGEHNLFLHGNSLYREAIHVPLILWQHGRTPPGVRVAQPVSNVALATTVMDWVGASDQRLFPGPSLARLWESGNPSPNWPYPLSELEQQAWVDSKFPVHHGAIKSYVSEQWQYIENEKLGIELYNWKDDPLEMRNMADKSEAQSILTLFRLNSSRGVITRSELMKADERRGAPALASPR